MPTTSYLSLGDLAQTYRMRRQNVALRSEITRLGQELSTGRASDTGAHLAGDLSGLAAIERGLETLNSYRVSVSEATVTAGAMQAALDRLAGEAGTLAEALLAAKSAGGAHLIGAAGAAARATFDAAVETLNARAADRSLFAGTATDGPALAGADQILAALQTEIAAETSAAGVIARIEAWFDPGGGFETSGYLGGTTDLAPWRAGPGQTVSLSVRADDTEVRALLAAAATAALADQSPIAGNPDELAELVGRAGELLLTAQSGLIERQADVGAAEAKLAEAATRNAAERSALERARADLLSVDPYSTATELEAVQGQLETLYALTARLSRLSLTDFLR